MIDFLITLLLVVLILGVVGYVIQHFFPLDPQIRQLVLLILGALFLIWLILALMGHAPVWRYRGP